jgi:hypothetical protein
MDRADRAYRAKFSLDQFDSVALRPRREASFGNHPIVVGNGNPYGRAHKHQS